MGIINFTKPVTGSFLVDIIFWLVQITSSVAVGIVLFTVILKVITLPFDYFSRASMRKNSIKMEEMRPELEKLQRQYADNKDLYNQKMMALYKKNGYSMFGACLPTILTLVIFIVAINAFTSYSQFQNRKYFYNMSVSYNNVLYSGLETDNEYIVRDEEGKIVIDYNKLLSLPSPVQIKDENGEVKHEIFYSVTESEVIVSTTNGYVQTKTDYKNENGQKVYSTLRFSSVEENLVKTTLISEENNLLKNEAGKTYLEAKLEAKAENVELTADAFLLDIQQLKSAETFRAEDKRFLWVKNIWVTDSPMKKPIEEDWKTFQTTHAYEGSDIGEAGYSSLIAKLGEEKAKANGYFILVIMTAGISLVTQLVMSKMQKAQMELQTVDGQGAQTQKIMTWMMPIMMAIFAFMYTAAFSIYIILSSVISLGTTFLINFIVDTKMKKEKAQTKTEKIRGRVYTPKQEEVKKEPEKKEKKKKDDKFAHEGGDFLSDDKNKKQHIRGRIK